MIKYDIFFSHAVKKRRELGNLEETWEVHRKLMEIIKEDHGLTSFHSMDVENLGILSENPIIRESAYDDIMRKCIEALHGSRSLVVLMDKPYESGGIRTEIGEGRELDIPLFLLHNAQIDPFESILNGINPNHFTRIVPYHTASDITSPSYCPMECDYMVAQMELSGLLEEIKELTREH